MSGSGWCTVDGYRARRPSGSTARMVATRGFQMISRAARGGQRLRASAVALLARSPGSAVVMQGAAPTADRFGGRRSRLRRRVALAGVVVVVAMAAIPAQAAQAATIQVPCSVPALVAAINTANSTSGADTLNLAGGCTYTLTAPDNAANGLPVITSDITINGNG